MRMHQHVSTEAKAEEGGLATAGRTIHWASRYDLAVRLLTLGQDRRLRERTVDLAGVRPGDRILDVGCGTGDLTLQAASRAGQSGEIFGIDAAPEMIEVARRKAAERGAVVGFRVGLVEDLPFPEQSFDVVLSSLMMHHLPETLKRQALPEILRVLKPGGRLVIVDMRRPESAPGRVVMALAMHGGLQEGIQDLPMLMAAAGFKEIEVGTIALGILGYTCGSRP